MIQFRKAVHEDIPAIVEMLADDELGSTREQFTDPLPECYTRAFAKMQNQDGNSVIVACEDAKVVACLQLTLIQGLARKGMLRAQIEGVRVHRSYRGKKIGEAIIKYAIAEARKAGATMVQLTTDRSRVDAHRFYERLGFKASHIGMKLALDE